jgi:hypothetical protein
MITMKGLDRVEQTKTPLTTIDALLDNQAKQMRHRFEEASISFKNTLDIGKKRELIFSDFLQEYLQPGYRTGNGEIIDQEGNRSGQVDVVVRNPFHPVSKRAPEEPELFLVEGVFCAFDVKSDLNRSELERGIEQIRSIKRLTKNIPAGSQFYGSPYDTIMMNKIHCGLFGFDSPSIPALKKAIDDINEDHGIKLDEQLDMVAVLDKGLIVNRKDPKDPREVITELGKALGVIGIFSREKTLQRFLWHLASLPDVMTVGRPIITDYLKLLSAETVAVIADKYA